jgi:hypothetical protein
VLITPELVYDVCALQAAGGEPKLPSEDEGLSQASVNMFVCVFTIALG